jgi:hypothetical protein
LDERQGGERKREREGGGGERGRREESPYAIDSQADVLSLFTLTKRRELDNIVDKTYV